jgi:hypothetical protein
MTTTSTPTRSRFVGGALIAFGVYSTLLGLFMLVAPGIFYDTVGAFGPRNNHYTFDNASFELPLGLLLLAAVRRPTWRVPALAFAALHWALHSISHIIDTGHADGRLVGLLEFAGLALGTILLTVALRASVIADKTASR